MRRIALCWIILCHLAVLSGAAAAQITTHPAPQLQTETTAEDLRPRIIASEDRILILTPSALYRFLPASETWTHTSSADGLPAGRLESLSLTDGTIWISSDGVSASDARFDDWKTYKSGEECPGRAVYAVESDGDYAYAATDKGPARFDQYILEWEAMERPGDESWGMARDVAVGEDRVWFALDDGIAEYRKETESFTLYTTLGRLESPAVLALRQTPRYIWAFAGDGIARYDKELQSWTSFETGVDFPDARIHQLTLQGDDLWLGTDEGLWSYSAETGIWRRDQSCDEMPGESVHAFARESNRIWVVTERAYAVYDEATARWIDFTAAVPMPPGAVVEMAWMSETLIYLGSEQIVYGLSQGQDNPNLFTFRSQEVLAAQGSDISNAPRWRAGLDDAGLGLVAPSGKDLHIKGGATIFIEDDDSGPDGGTGLGDLITDTRYDLTLTGRMDSDRTLSGFYDTTDPDNSKYQLTYRGARSDVLRSVSLGEIEQQLFNTRLAPGTGLRGGHARVEMGDRSESTHRRLLTADAWAGKRRTLPGRDVYYGGNRAVDSRIRDTGYVQGMVFPLPEGWTSADLRDAVLYHDDGVAGSDNANTEDRIIAGLSGSWDRLEPFADYIIGSNGGTLILAAPLGGGESLTIVNGAHEADLTGGWLRNRYFITIGPVPGSLAVSISDSTGSLTDPQGESYLSLFGLDANGDGLLDPDHFSPITGLLSFPEPLPFPAEIYADEPVSLYDINVTYQATLNTFRLSHRDLAPGSERITVDREQLRADVDYSMIPASGLFVFFEHILLDDDSVIEVEYLYEVGEGSTASDEGLVVAGQAGFAPDDHLFFGANATRWRDDQARDITTADLNARLEWKDERRFLRVTPELAVSRTTSGEMLNQSDENGTATGAGFQGRYDKVELSGSYRNLGGEYASFEDRRTLLGRLREASELKGRWEFAGNLQAEVEWEKRLSDQIDPEGLIGGASSSGADSSAISRYGEESSLTAGLKLLRSGLPNLEIRRGRVLLNTPGQRQEKWISRAELEVSPDQAGLTPFGIRRLWLRAFVQRSDREWRGGRSGEAEDSLNTATEGKRTTDHAFIRLNGSVGNPFSWNLAFEDRRTHLPDEDQSQNLRRYQEVDATLQTRPHSALDAYLRWESHRDLFWHPEGRSGGFDVKRLLLGTLQLYPGRLMAGLSRLSFRFDVGTTETEDGEPGVSLPGGGSLFTEASGASQIRRTRSGMGEARVQLLTWMRLVERWEQEKDLNRQEGLATEGTKRQLESRLEMKPSGGNLMLRLIGSTADEGLTQTETRRRFTGQWDQTWGRGWLTYLSLEAQKVETGDRQLGELTHLYNPTARVTWRRSRWRLDASLSGGVTWTRTKDIFAGAGDDWETLMKQSVTSSLSFHPAQTLAVKIQYVLSRSERVAEDWETDHDLRIRLQIRA
ncbi:MAG: hypothetical protein KJ970_13970 [Candidatus Eisenbacteria bacterium]|uniref:EF-hand domain-containing protein n=1 Tax=Eiseniibacteriota bacterium TaxID=2212470 RepID=A0A948RZG9_UNCEI|nr:hypothetical protein [Candidatus Eisenbacteria bacterium]MBU1948645.1 hypothetical protein [Candidatus Eisenbacteria bacterium]MBU2692022.1 hypothetical protein [Candidatus Eisenbacteria bacterium]